MWKNEKISVVIPAHNEEETVREIVEEVFREAPVDEVVVVDNNSIDGTAEEIKKTKARLVFEEKKGYGNALIKGLAEATGDLVMLFDADGNFPAKDIRKLLEYSDDFDFVKGTRARKELTEKGIYDSLTTRIGILANVVVAKFQQFLFRGPALTDAGCTLRLIRRKSLKKIMPYFTVGGGHFLVDMTNLAMLAKIKTVEVPVLFTKRRGGKSKHGSFRGLAKIAVAMVLHTIKQRLLSLFGYYKFDQ